MWRLTALFTRPSLLEFTVAQLWSTAYSTYPQHIWNHSRSASLPAFQQWNLLIFGSDEQRWLSCDCDGWPTHFSMNQSSKVIRGILFQVKKAKQKKKNEISSQLQMVCVVPTFSTFSWKVNETHQLSYAFHQPAINSFKLNVTGEGSSLATWHLKARLLCFALSLFSASLTV